MSTSGTATGGEPPRCRFCSKQDPMRTGVRWKMVRAPMDATGLNANPTSPHHCAPSTSAPSTARTPVYSMQPGLRPPCVLSPDPVTTPGRPVPGGCVRGGRQTALPRRRRAAATISTRTQRALPCCRAGRPPARPGARAGRIGTSARLAPRTPSTTRRHSNWCRASHAGGSARYVDGTRRLPISPLIDTYLVPEAPQGARSDPTPPLATTSAIGHRIPKTSKERPCRER